MAEAAPAAHDSDTLPNTSTPACVGQMDVSRKSRQLRPVNCHVDDGTSEVSPAYFCLRPPCPNTLSSQPHPGRLAWGGRSGTAAHPP